VVFLICCQSLSIALYSPFSDAILLRLSSKLLTSSVNLRDSFPS
jgi:hypothetical protein